MQIGNNRPNGPQPRDPKNSHLDPDLTKSNRDGIEQVSRAESARIQEAAKERAKPAPMETRSKPMDTFERSRPQDDPGMDVAERIKNARSQKKATRIEGAREKDAMKTSEAAMAKGERIANARAQNATSVGQDSVRTEMGTGDGGVVAEAKRIESARSQSVDAAMATRIQNARDGQMIELPGLGGSRETKADRSERVESLRAAHEAGELNTPERAREAAGKLLGGE